MSVGQEQQGAAWGVVVLPRFVPTHSHDCYMLSVRFGGMGATMLCVRLTCSIYRPGMIADHTSPFGATQKPHNE